MTLVCICAVGVDFETATSSEAEKGANEQQLPVQLGSPRNYAEGPCWVDSCPCYFSYIESVSSSEFGATADARQAAGYDIWLAAVLPEPANNRHTA